MKFVDLNKKAAYSMQLLHVILYVDKCDAESHYYFGFIYNYNGGSLSFLLTTTEPQPVNFSIEAPSQSYSYRELLRPVTLLP